MTKRLMVTGAGGFVAGSILYQAGAPWSVHALSRGGVLLDRDGVTWHTVDCEGEDALQQVFRDVAPDAVIHTAALANIDYCEAHPDEARAVNLTFTRRLMALCRDSGARLIFCSTDTVFGGNRGMYREEDPPRPLNVYAETKAAAEEAVLDSLDNAVVARLSLVMGLQVLRPGNSFLAKMLESFERGEVVGVPDNEIRTPIDVITVGAALLELAGNTTAGILHLSGNDRLNRYEMVRRIALRLGYPEGIVQAKDPTTIPGRANRPLDASLDNAQARRTLVTPMFGVVDGLDLVLRTVRGKGEKNWTG